jgi:plasmid replication initiation protein
MHSMVTETPNPDEQLLPIRHSKSDLFICDVADAVFKDIMPQMEHPFYALSKRPDTAIRRYEHNGEWIDIVPSVKGMPTIYDKDILIYCISQVMHKLKREERVSQYLRITAIDLLMFTNRGTAGKDYNALCEALDRLEGVKIKTNIITGGIPKRHSFGLIDSSSAPRKHGTDGRLQWVEIKLSDWVFDAIRSKEVLTLHRDYFRLSKPLERRVYELARKHCGRQKEWKISLETLLKKSGSQSPIKRFRQMLKHIAVHDHLPDYRVTFNEKADQVTFYNRQSWWANAPVASDGESLPELPTEAYEDGRDAAPGYDIYQLEREWREFWVGSGKPKIDNATLAFVGFCRGRHKRAPIQRERDEDGL